MHDKIFNLPEINMRALTASLYVLGAGAFGFFLRWIQHQMAFDELGLVKASVFNILLPFYMLICAYLANNYIKNLYEDGYFVPETMKAVRSYTGLATVLRILFALVMIIGAVLLFVSCDTDKNSSLLKIVSVLSAVTAVCVPIYMHEADNDEPNLTLSCFASFVPILFFCAWLIETYKANDINSVIWSYAIELITVCVCVLAYFRIAGFAYGSPRGKKALFSSMAAVFLCFMSLADSRYLGMQLMIAATFGNMLMYVWLIIENLEYEQPVDTSEENPGGFERIDGNRKKKKRIF